MNFLGTRCTGLPMLAHLCSLFPQHSLNRCILRVGHRLVLQGLEPRYLRLFVELDDTNEPNQSKDPDDSRDSTCPTCLG